MEKYFVTRNQKKVNHAGSKAVSDTEIIMEKLGYKRITIYPRIDGIQVIKKSLNILSLLSFEEIKKDSLVVLEHPLYLGGRYLNNLLRAKRKKHFKLVVLVHDFDRLRGMFSDDKELVYIEKCLLKYADNFIVHNEKMKKAFIEKLHVEEDRLTVLELFDYLCTINEEKEDDSSAIVLAGNLNKDKSGYVYELSGLEMNTPVNLYGVNYSEEENKCKNDNVRYMGSVDPDELPDKMSGRYGLVWDGNSLDCCGGKNGKYLTINNPHKTSLYIAGNLPVIIWDQAALADLVTKYKIGFTIGSLKELDERIGAVTEAEYAEYRRNIKEISEKVRSGYFLSRALKSIEENLEKQ